MYEPKKFQKFRNTFERNINHLVKHNEIDRALNYIFKVLDDRLIDKEYTLINGVLESLNLEIFTVELLIGILCICNHYQKHLSSYERIRQHLIELVNNTYPKDEARQILNGIE